MSLLLIINDVFALQLASTASKAPVFWTTGRLDTTVPSSVVRTSFESSASGQSMHISLYLSVLIVTVANMPPTKD